MDEWHSKYQIDWFYLYYNQYISGATYRPHSLQLLPVNREWLKQLEKEKWESRSLPVFSMDWDSTVLITDPGVPVCIALQGVCRIAGQRERQPARRNAERGKKYWGAPG